MLTFVTGAVLLQCWSAVLEPAEVLVHVYSSKVFFSEDLGFFPSLFRWLLLMDETFVGSSV